MKMAKMLELMGDENPAWENIKFVCTSPRSAEDPAPWLSMPRTYYLDEPDQYFMTDILVRHHSKLQRSQWQAAFRSYTVQQQHPCI